MGQVSALALLRLPAELRRALARELALVDARLAADERVLSLATGEHAGRRGILVATDRRLVFLARARPEPALHECPYRLIAEVHAIDDALRIVDSSGGGASVTRVRPGGRAAQIADVVERLVRHEDARAAGLPARPEPPEPLAGGEKSLRIL